MKRILMAALTLVGLLLTTAPARAADVVDEAIATLQTTSVYVAKGAEKTDTNSAAIIQGYLRQGDHIVIVLLPKGATKLTNDEIASKVLDSLAEHSILGLYSNGQLSAYSRRPSLSQLDVSDMMARASQVNMNLPVESMTTFTKLVHQYQAAHPEPTPTVNTTAGNSGPGTGLLIVIGIGMVCAIGGVSLVVYGSSRTRRAATDDTSAPSEIRQFTELADQLAEDVAKVANIRDRENMRVMLDTLRDVVAKTRRKRPQVAVVTASNLAEQLNIMRTIVGGYLDDQEYPNLRGAQERLSGYSNAFANFRHFAEERMAELLAENYDALQFEINRWRPMDDNDVPSSLNLSADNRPWSNPQDRK
ncbi:MAG TPA: hypothetical protein PKV96_02980 [Candidatus Saccharimonas sp.]|nr:hypothetical protein [Candidatus Saccharimonas sp.]